MIVKLDILIGVVQQMEILMNELVENTRVASCKGSTCETCQPQELEELMSKQEVLDYLQISDRTYRRQVESGLLKPMNIGGGDFYFKSQLVAALKESRRRGRV